MKMLGVYKCMENWRNPHWYFQWTHIIIQCICNMIITTPIIGSWLCFVEWFKLHKYSWEIWSNVKWVIPEKIHTPRRMGFWNFSWEGGSKTLEIQAGGGVELEEVCCRSFYSRKRKQDAKDRCNVFAMKSLKRLTLFYYINMLYCLMITCMFQVNLSGILGPTQHGFNRSTVVP